MPANTKAIVALLDALAAAVHDAREASTTAGVRGSLATAQRMLADIETIIHADELRRKYGE